MPNSPLPAWHRLVASGEPDGVENLLADDVVFYSPVVFRPQPGKAITAKYLTAAFQVLFRGGFRYVRELSGDDNAMVEFEAEIDGTVVNGVDLIRWNEQGKITEFKVMLRPLKAVNLVHQKMAEALQIQL